MVRASESPSRRRGPGRPPAETNRRERLLDAAIECYATDGVAATSVRGIAARAGVTPALVNYYFGGKERLLEAIVQERLMPLVAGLRAALESAGDDPRELASAFVHGMHAAVERHPWLPALWVREVLTEKGALRDVLLPQLAPQVPRVLAERFAKARAGGTLPGDLDPRLLIVSLMGLTLFPLAAAPIWRRLLDAADVDAAALRRHTLALLRHGLEASDAS